MDTQKRALAWKWSTFLKYVVKCRLFLFQGIYIAEHAVVVFYIQATQSSGVGTVAL